jgi:hypothetical protein
MNAAFAAAADHRISGAQTERNDLRRPWSRFLIQERFRF